MRKLLIASLAAVSVGSAAAPGARAAEAPAPPALSWSFGGLFGGYDRAQLRRGLQVYQGVCASCHGLRHVHYRNLLDIGLTAKQIEEIAGQKKVPGEPDEAGDPTERNAGANDPFVGPFKNDNAAKAANNGAVPPDLALMAKAREGGPDYIHGILTGYSKPPADWKEADGTPKTLGTGQYYNKYFPGHVTAMAPPLTGDGQVDYPQDGPKATVDQMARDVSAFLMWAAEPKLEDRKRMGIKVILFLLVMTGFFYAIYRKVWADVKKKHA
jgi:ubiquinol-cytochrome c reductase cytochrome c1 subunit